jgi:hypothetical protein
VHADVPRGLENETGKRLDIFDPVRANRLDDQPKSLLRYVFSRGRVAQTSRGEQTQPLRESEDELLFR